MITTLLFDLAGVLLFANDKSYKGELNVLHAKLFEENPSYDFFSYFNLNNELLDFLKIVKDKFKLYMFTSGTMQNATPISSAFDRVFESIISGKEIGFSKQDPEVYIRILKIIDKTAAEVLFIDDWEINTEAAKKAGLSTWQFKNNSDLINKIKSIK